MYYLSKLRRGTVCEGFLVLWERVGKTGKGILGLRRDEQMSIVHQSEDTYIWSQEIILEVYRSHCSSRMDETNVGVIIIDVGVIIIDGLVAFQR
jgi:hypothetical protein